MARPITTRETVRAQAPQSPNAPGLGVYAPLSVNAGPSDPLQGLGQALGVFTQIGGRIKQEREQENDKQGYADAQLGQVDEEKKSKSEKYADGVYRFSVLDQFGKAVQSIEERAASGELPENLSAQEKVAWYDQQLKGELSDLALDPQARALIAERYTSFINQVGSRELNENLESNKKLALETVQTDVSRQLADGSFDPVEQFHAISSVVGRGEAWGVLTEAVSSYAEQVGDTKLLEQIPASITLADGQVIAGPRNTPKHRERIRQARDRIEREQTKRIEQAAAKRRYEVLDGLNNMVLAAELITDETFAQKGITVGDQPGTDLTAAQGIEWKNRALAAREAKDKEDGDWRTALEVKRASGGIWLDTENKTGGAKDKAEAQKFYDREVKETVVSLTGDESLVGGAGFGEAVVQDLTQNRGQGIAKIAFGMSALQRLPYTPLKTWMSEVTPSAPKAVLQRLPAYQEAKAKNVAHLYVDDDAAALYEAAIAANASGDDPAEVLRRYGDRDTATYVSENFPKASVRGKTYTLDFRGFNTTTAKLGNRAYAEGRMDALIRTGLSRGLTVQQSQEFARSRFMESHELLNVGDKEWTLPRQVVGNPQEAQGALDYFSGDVIKAKEAELGIDDLELRMSSANGREPEFYLYSNLRGQQSSFFPLSGAVRVWKKNRPQTVRDTRAEADATAKRKRDMTRMVERGGYPGAVLKETDK